MGLLRGGSEGSFPKHSLWLKASLTAPSYVYGYTVQSCSGELLLAVIAD